MEPSAACHVTWPADSVLSSKPVPVDAVCMNMDMPRFGRLGPAAARGKLALYRPERETGVRMHDGHFAGCRQSRSLLAASGIAHPSSLRCNGRASADVSETQP